MRRLWIGVVLLAAATASAAPPEVHVDARVELLATVFRLAGAPEFNQGATPYVEAVKKHFAPYADHPAVSAARELRERWHISHDAVMVLAVYLDAGTGKPLRPLSPAPPGFDARWRGAPIDDFVAKLADFARVSDLGGFLKAQARYFEAVEGRFVALAVKHDLRSWIDGYFGPRAGARSVVVPGPQNGGNNFGLTVALPDGSEILYQVMALDSPDAAGLPSVSEGTLALWAHESSHPYVNPLVDANGEALRRPGERLLALVRKQMAAQAYTTWSIVLSESLVRASVIVYLRDKLGAAAARHELVRQESLGFFWIEDLVTLLGAKKVTLAAAMPDVIALLQGSAERAVKEGIPKRPFRGPINAVFGGPAVYVAAPGLQAYVQAIKARFKVAAAPLLLPGDAAWKQAGAAVIVYASPSSSGLVAEQLARHGEAVDAAGVTAGGKRFPGAGLVLITSHAHPLDPTRPMLLYTAATDDLLDGVNSVFHGPTDWVVARRLAPGKYQPIASGDHPTAP